MPPLPTRRRSLEGATFDGDRLRLSFSIARKLYVCPDCRRPIGVGAEHVFVHFLDADAPWDHEHWHAACVEHHILRSLASQRWVPAPRPPRPSRRRKK